MQPIAAKQHSQSAERSPVVVIVDDDLAVCSSLKFALELEGFAIRSYGSADELLSAGDLVTCDCFVIDQRMPGMSGMELIAKLRDRKVLTPTILLISHLNPALSARRDSRCSYCRETITRQCARGQDSRGMSAGLTHKATKR